MDIAGVRLERARALAVGTEVTAAAVPGGVLAQADRASRAGRASSAMSAEKRIWMGWKTERGGMGLSWMGIF
ncbi:MAG: hypothetical protein P4L50_16085 [Anaerolineaceae bacterium]|nr:hypothetical protein [Anaerolineaceae bacterium]